LAALVPQGNDRLEQAKLLFEKLSDPDYHVRQQATKDLYSLSGVSLSTLKSFEDKLASPEGKYRLKTVIAARSESGLSQIQYVALNQIKMGNLTGMSPLIVEAFPYLEPEDFVLKGASAAIESSATEADAEMFGRVISDSKNLNWLRAGCLGALSRIKPKAAQDAASRLVGQSGELGLEVAKVLVHDNQISSIDALLALLSDKNIKVKFFAFNVIQGITGLSFEGNYLADNKSVSKAKAQVKTWLLENSDKQISFRWPKNLRLGRRLICRYESGEVLELDESNNVVWTQKAKNPFCCLGLPNGSRFVVEYASKNVLEYDASGKEVRRISLPATSSGICVQPNGEIWVAAGQGDDKLYKLSPKGKTLQKFVLEGKPTSVEVGLSGNLVCALYKDKRVVEVDSAGKIVKSIPVKGDPYHAQPLSSGNYLVAFPVEGRITEYAPDGKMVWTHDCAKNSYRAQELEDGTIMFGDANGIHRINRGGEKIEAKSFDSGEIHYSYSY